MKAIVLQEPGSIDHLIVRELPLPEPGENEVLIAVNAISINPVDVKTRKGNGIFKNGHLKSHVSKIYSFEQMSAAHLQVETGRTVGKVVVVF